MKTVYHETIAPAQTHQPFLDGLRGIAILMVLTTHSLELLGGDYRFPMLRPYIVAGARGVQLFFMISAFTLFLSMKNRTQSERYPIISFYIRRAFRIWPLWWIACALYGWRDHHTAKEILSSATFLFGFLRAESQYDVVPGGWSLFVEESFYLFFPLFFFWARRASSAMLLLLVTYLGSILWAKWAPNHGVLDGNSFVYLFPISHYFCFFFGIVLFHIWESTQAKGVRTPLQSVNPRIYDGFALLGLCHVNSGHRLASFALFAIFLASLNPGTFTRRIVESRIIGRFGAYCYSIYLLQWIILHPIFARYHNFDRILAFKYTEVRALVVFPPLLVLFYFLGYLSFHLIEKPCVRLGRRALLFVNSARVP